MVWQEVFDNLDPKEKKISPRPKLNSNQLEFCVG